MAEKNQLDELVIAQVCHEANRAYCESIGDFSQPAWDEAPQWQRDSAINGVRFHLAHLAEGHHPAPSHSHEEWMAQKLSEGWKYGPTKNAETKEHPCIVPYNELPLAQQLKDYIFAGIVQAFHDANTASLIAS